MPMFAYHNGSLLEDGVIDDEKWEGFEDFDEKPVRDLRLSTYHQLRKLGTDLIHSLYPSNTMARSHDQLRPTAYLDGLRGFAALLVYWHHHQLWAHEAASPNQSQILENAFGYENQYHFACLPIVRIFFTGGHLAVTVFFVISGMVLANKPLMLIQSGELTALGDNLASAMFRRWLRLYTPVIATTFLFMASWHVFGFWIASANAKPSYGDELWNWFCEIKNFSYIFRTGGEPWFSYNFHAWSIPVEFKGSTVVYTSLLAFSRCSRNARLLLQVCLVIYFLYIADGAFFAMFVSGTILSDVSLLSARNDLPSSLQRSGRFKNLIFPILFVFGLYLGSVPSQSSDIAVLKSSPGWYILSFLKPQAVFDYKWFYLFFAATMLVASIPNMLCLKSFFESQINQYLGRISFAFYLVHGPVLWILGDRLYVATGWVRESHLIHLPQWIGRYPVSRAGPLGMEFNFLVVHLVTLPVTICLADLVTKTIDDGSIQLSSWVYRKAITPPSSDADDGIQTEKQA
ncbi:hypothetical protein ACLMJK_002855 [Lecanora helva]